MFAGVCAPLVKASLLVKHKAYGEPGSQLPARVDELREGSRKLANDLIQSESTWEEGLSDDYIWIHATSAEARPLREEWKDAARFYKNACAQRGVMPFHRESMRKQVERIVEAFDRLGIEVGEPFDDLDEIFGPTADS